MDPRRRMERKIKQAIREVEALVRQQDSGKTLKKRRGMRSLSYIIYQLFFLHFFMFF